MFRAAFLALLIGMPAPAFAQDIVAAMQAATDRFAGQIVAAELVDGRPEERTQEVFQFRMLTEAGDILRIRVDAQNRDILEVDGYGLVAARKKASQ